MPSKRVILAIIAVALAFGAVVSGCNRDSETRMAQAGRKSQKETAKKSWRRAMGEKNRTDSRADRRRGADDIELAQAPAVRPAEVLAATVRRPQQRRGPAERPQPMYQQNYQPLPVAIAMSQNLARVQEPLPEPIPVSQYMQTRTAPYYSTSQVAPAPQQVVHPSPELAMARAALEPVSFAAPVFAPRIQPISAVPPIEPQMFRAPIPELEPVRYQRVAATGQPRQIPPLMSGSASARRDSLRPIAQETRGADESQPSLPRIQGWVPSPVTAMGGVRGTY